MSRHGRTSDSTNQRSPPSSFTSVARSLLSGSGFSRSSTSGSTSQFSLPSSFTSVARSLLSTNRSGPPETASVHTATQGQVSRWRTSVIGGAPTESDARSTVAGSSAQNSTKLYVYYRVFTKDGAIPCKRPVDKRNRFLARVEAMHISPPHTAESIIRCLCKREGRSTYRFSQLFSSAPSATPMDRKQHVALLTGSGPGSNPRQPLALLLVDESDLYSKAIVAKCNEYTYHIKWLGYKKGEVLYTNGVKQQMAMMGDRYYVYHARKANGKCGFVDPSNFSEPR